MVAMVVSMAVIAADTMVGTTVAAMGTVAVTIAIGLKDAAHGDVNGFVVEIDMCCMDSDLSPMAPTRGIRFMLS